MSIEQLLFGSQPEVKKPVLTYEVDSAELKPAIEEACMQINAGFTRRELLKIRRIKSNKNRKGNRLIKIQLPI